LFLQGSKAAMKVISEADVVLALGTRLGPFGSLPQYDFDYWPKTAKIIQVDTNHRRLGLTKDIDIGICGDARLATKEITALLHSSSTKADCLGNAAQRVAKAKEVRDAWEAELDKLSAGNGAGKEMTPRQALRELEKAMPEVGQLNLGKCTKWQSIFNLGRDRLHRHRQHLLRVQQLPPLQPPWQLPGGHGLRQLRSDPRRRPRVWLTL
jgi:thiamine pyrophosphate-dependent acetolactate synthase large subunit-like protein